MILKIVYTDLYWAAGHNVNDRSYNDDPRYAYELFFDDQADTEMIKERMLYVYNSSKESFLTSTLICLTLTIFFTYTTTSNHSR